MRIPANSFLKSEIRFEQALKFQPVIIEGCIIFAVLWTFGTILNDQAKKVLDKKLKEKIDPLKTDFVSF